MGELFPNQSYGRAIYKHANLPLYQTDEFDVTFNKHITDKTFYRNGQDKTTYEENNEKIVTVDKEYLVRENLHNIVERLDSRFKQSHRSCYVNIKNIKSTLF